MSGSHFIMQTSKFLLISATALNLGQCYRKVSHYIQKQKSERSEIFFLDYPMDKLSQTDEGAERQMDAGNNNIPPTFRSKG